MIEGGVKADTILFGKYRLDRIIGKGRTGTVWLAVHLGLEEYRAIKQVSKESVEYEAFRREALILKGLRHPAIPIVYDLEEDQNFLYLIHEYVIGKSLYALVSQQGVMPETEAVRHGLQICSLVEFLHFAEEKPILFLDLQPKNLIISGGTVKIIDFGQAAFAECCMEQTARYGTVGCAAPEQYTSDQILDTRTDIYAIGAVLSFMVSGDTGAAQRVSGEMSAGLRAIIGKCMEQDKDKRFDSVKELEARLNGLLRSEGAGKFRIPTEKQIPPLAVAVAGSREGTGATHLALALCGYLERAGIRTLYEEHNCTGHVRRLAELYGSRADDSGVFHIAGLSMKPWYGQAVVLPEALPEAVVRDYGTDWEALERDWGVPDGSRKAGRGMPGASRSAGWGASGGSLGADPECPGRRALLMTAGASPWEQEDCARMVETLRGLWTDGRGTAALMLFRSGSGARAFRRYKGGMTAGVKLFLEPSFEEPLRPGVQGEAFLKELWSAAAGGRAGRRSWLKECRIGRRAFFAVKRRIRAIAGSSALSEPGGKQE